MRKLLLLSIAAAGLITAAAGQADAGNICRYSRCTQPPERAVPEPGAAAVFALGAGLVALRTRRAR